MAIDSAFLINSALDVGFDRVGIAPANVPLGQETYRVWLEQGMAGQLSYMPRNASLRTSVRGLLPNARSVVAVAINYYQKQPWDQTGPRIARYALGRDYHKVVKSKLREVVRRAQIQAPGESFRILVDSAPVFERAYAHHAGLGWFGKNTCLIDSRTGSWFLLGLLATSAELEPSQPSPGGCGRCQLCVEACPTGAIKFVEGRWMVDARDCISALTIEQKGPFSDQDSTRISEWTFGCDVCQEVCPFNQPRARQPERAQETQEPDFRNVYPWPSLMEIINWTEAEWDVATRGSAVRRAGYQGLKRNAYANLTNTTLDSSKIGT